MKQKLLSVLLTMCLVLSMIPATMVTAHADRPSGACGDNATWTLTYDATRDGVLVISGTGDMWARWSWENWEDYYAGSVRYVEIADGITNIGDYAFAECGMTSVTIPDSVTNIGDSSFSGCTALTSVTIPDSVTSIGYSTFSRCTALAAVTIPDSVTTIGSYAFAYCSALTTVTIPDGVTSIGYSTFSGCTALAAVTIPDSVTSISNWAFSYCDALTAVTIPDSVTSIGDSSFSGCGHLRTVIFRGAAPHIGYAFPNVTATVYYPAGDASWTAECGENYGGDLTWVSYSDVASITYIVEQPQTVFAQADTRVKFHVLAYGPGITYQWQVKTTGGDWTDSTLTGARTDTLSVKATESRDGYRYRCVVTDKNGVQVVSDPAVLVVGVGVAGGTCGENLTWKLGDEGTLTISGTGPMDEYEYMSRAPWYSLRDSVKQVVMKPGVTTIGVQAFSQCSALTSVTIPDSVTTIGDHSFSGCSALTAVTIPDSVTSIGNWAFSNCEALTAVTIPDSVTTIGYGAFFDCYALTSVTIPGSVTTIRDQTFSWCSALTSVTIPDSVTTIGNWAFSWCESLTSVTIPDGATIGGAAFSRCESLKSVTLPSDLRRVEWQTFYCCESLASVALPDSVTDIAYEAFEGCSNLQSVDLPTNLQSIGSRTFAGTDLRSIDIPAGVTNLGDRAFNSTLRLVTFRGDAPAMVVREEDYRDGTFADVTATAYYPANNPTWTEEVRNADYGGNLTWVSGEPDPEGNGPAITGQPQDVTGAVGETAKFTVTATGDGLSYQWQYCKTGETVWQNSGMSGAKTATLSVKITEARDGQRYRCVVTDASGKTVTSEPATLTVKVGPVITGQPQDVTANVGETAKFTVAATGDGLRYQWQYKPAGEKTWHNSTSATVGYRSATLQVAATKARNGYQYRCIVTDASGNTVTSEAVTLTVKTAPVITGQPQDVTANVGETAKFTVAATGDGLRYQWQYKPAGEKTWHNSTSATVGYRSATLQVAATKARNGYQYRCVITDAGGNTVTSEAVTLTVKTAPVITGQPQNVTANVGETAKFTVTATGDGLSYQWQYKPAGEKTWHNSTSATVGYRSATLQVAATKARNGYQYRCIVTDAGGNTVTSDAVTLTVKVGPVITGQPVSYTGAVGETAKFTVAATGDGLSYQWQYCKTGETVWQNSGMSGANTATLSVKITQGRDGQQYRCVVTDANGNAVTSETATLTVKK